MTQTDIPALPQTPPWVHPAVYDREYFRMSVERYEQLGRDGILTTNDRMELIEGNLVSKPVQNDLHASTVETLTNLFVSLAPAGWRARIQLPIPMHETA